MSRETASASEAELQAADSELQRRALAAPRRVVMLGASNLARSVSTIVESAHAVFNQPLDMLVAAGHGRSYGRKTWFMGRGLPSIKNCAIWEALERRPPAPTAALVTDVGNDLLYEVPVRKVVDWLEFSLDALGPNVDRLVLTQLPVDNVNLISPRRFRFLRAVMFPGSQITLQEVADGAQRLNEELERMAAERNAVFAKVDPRWYGFDAIHLRLFAWSSAWSQMLAGWNGGEAISPARGSLGRWLWLRLSRPDRRWWWGLEQRAAQPISGLSCGGAISLY